MSNTGRVLFGALILVSSVALGQNASLPTAVVTYTGDRQLTFPERYREWVYLTSGFDMSYSAAAKGGQHLFDNLFVNPQAYRAFVGTGTWPDGTALVLELRRAGSKDPINTRGFRIPLDTG